MPRRLLSAHPGGRRGVLVSVLGAVWILMGVGIITGASAPDITADLIHLLIPAPLRVALWIGTGTVAFVLAHSPRWSWIGVAGLAIMPLIRGWSYLWAWVTWLIPGAPDGYADGWYSGIFYLLALVLVAVAADMPPNPPLTPSSGRRKAR